MSEEPSAWKFSGSKTQKELEAMLAAGILHLGMSARVVHGKSDVIQKDVKYEKFKGSYYNWRRMVLTRDEIKRTGGRAPPAGRNECMTIPRVFYFKICSR